MKKADFIRTLAERTGETIKKTTEFVDAALALSTDALVDGKDITFTGLFSVKVAETPARERRNPATGESFMAPAKKVVKVKIGKSLKDTVNA